MSSTKTYQTRKTEFQHLLDEKQQQSWLLPWLRATFFIGSILLLILGLSGDLFKGWSFLLGLSVIAFIISVSIHRRLKREVEDAELLVKINQQALDRLAGKWQESSQKGERYQTSEHAYAEDLDIVGADSLFQMLNTTTTRFGEDTLASWLLERANISEIKTRQELVKDLRDRLELRQELQREGLRVGTEAKSQDPELFLRWAESPSLLKERYILKWILKLLPIWTFVALVIYLINNKFSLLFWLIPLIIQTIIWGKTSNEILPHLADVASRQKAFSLYGSLFKRIEEEKAEDDTGFSVFRKEIEQRSLSPYKSMIRLQFFVDLIDVRHTPMMHIPLNMFFLWDLQCLYYLEKWKKEIGSDVRGWFAWLGKFEALSSLASLAFDYPSYAFPKILEDKELCYEATNLGHPLVHEKTRIDNDLSLTSERSFAIITGSNMSGKSTFLRAIGLNAVLAYSGSVVCATSLKLSLMQIGSSMRIKDSLEHGISYFMAELYRIKRILSFKDQGLPLLYLLDEILHGTNTMERRKAALFIIEELQKAQAIGLITTHDLDLAKSCKTFGDNVQYSHFTDGIKDGKMIFDYILREGICPSTNALKLMQAIGIPITDIEK